MKNNRVNLLLLFSILTMAILPLLSAFYLLDHTLQTSLNLGFNREIVNTLETASQNLKRLKATDVANESHYRTQFEEIENLKLVYSKPELVRNNILDSLKIYFGLGLAVAVLLALSIATLLGRKISASYSETFRELVRQKDKVRYLEEISSWQELAKMLAHEIKNPLTPIEMLISTLVKSYSKKSAEEFQVQLKQTESMVHEELGHLKNVVNRFSEFSRLPAVELKPEDLIQLTKQNVQVLASLFDEAEIQFTSLDEGTHQPCLVNLDSTLFRQVLTNIVKNGVEANPKKKVVFEISVTMIGESVQIAISNSGQPVPVGLAERIFDPYISSKSKSENMGLGLAIVKKIIVEHGGEISYTERQGLPVFVISLKKVG